MKNISILFILCLFYISWRPLNAAEEYVILDVFNGPQCNFTMGGEYYLTQVYTQNQCSFFLSGCAIFVCDDNHEQVNLTCYDGIQGCQTETEEIIMHYDTCQADTGSTTYLVGCGTPDLSSGISFIIGTDDTCTATMNPMLIVRQEFCYVSNVGSESAMMFSCANGTVTTNVYNSIVSCTGNYKSISYPLGECNQIAGLGYTKFLSCPDTTTST